MALEVFVDYDGTITNLDTFDVLVRACAGAREWEDLETCLRDGSLTLREVLQRQAAFVRIPFEQADAILREHTIVDPAFPNFVRACRAREIPVTILSSGIRPLIARAMERCGLRDIPIIANEVTPSAEGWTIDFIDESDNGHDKAAAVCAAVARGSETMYCGDGHSDFAAALVAQRRFVKAGRALERYLRESGTPFDVFTSFSEVERTVL